MKINKNKVLPLIQADAAGIDIGAREIFVAIPRDRSKKPVRRFDTFTEDLHKAAKWMKEKGVESIAMESTGVYWIPIYQILESYGFKVFLVNARHVKNVPGRKTDVQDCQWLQYLHCVGLLSSSYRPEQKVCAIRSLLRHRDNLIKMATTHVLHMQKALTQMNIQIHNVISDITGKTGLNIIDSILSGIHDPKKLAEYKNKRIKASKATIEKSLVGDYRTEHLFTLRQALQSYRFCHTQIKDCDIEIERQLIEFESKHENSKRGEPEASIGPKQRRAGNAPAFDQQGYMYRIFGTDLTWIDGISGGKIFSSKTKSSSNKAAQVFRLAAVSLIRSKSYLGDYFRKMRARHGALKAITATAHKLARIVYYLIKHQKSYDESVFSAAQKRYQDRQLKRLKKQAKYFGFQLLNINKEQLVT